MKFARPCSVLVAIALGAITACTDARLFSDEGPLAQADRVTLKGRICTRDPMTADMPLRIVIVADRAPGPLFSSFDPGAVRVQILRAFAQSALGSQDTELAVVSFAGRSRKLAPMDGNFTRNPGELIGAINQLAMVDTCLGTDQCRDYLEGMRTARSLIEGDLASTPAGDRVLTQYVVMLLVAGPHQPLAQNIDCCADDDAACLSQVPAPSNACQAQLEQEELAKMIAAINDAGALGLKLHVIHLAAETPAVNDQLQSQFQNLVFTGSGSYQRVSSADSMSPSALDVIEARTPLRVKTLFAANLNAKPTPSGPVVDSDADGLSDEEEDLQGTSAGNRDTDGDGLGDMVETLVDFDPFTVDDPTACAQVVPSADSDLDGLSDCDEALIGTELSLVDTDGDGMPDPLELESNTDYLHRDAEADADGDGASNSDEILQRTDPRSIDTQSHLSSAYRYTVEDEGVVKELFPAELIQLTGVQVVTASSGTTPGVGLIRYDPVQHSLQWQDALDTTLGPAIVVDGGGYFDLPSSSWAPEQGDDGRFIRVQVDEVNLPPPPDQVNEALRFIQREHQCLTYTIRNIRLMETRELEDGSPAGLNRIVLFFGETPEDRIGSPGPFRLAEVPVIFHPPDQRDPDAPILQVLEEEFVSPR